MAALLSDVPGSPRAPSRPPRAPAPRAASAGGSRGPRGAAGARRRRYEARALSATDPPTSRRRHHRHHRRASGRASPRPPTRAPRVAGPGGSTTASGPGRRRPDPTPVPPGTPAGPPPPPPVPPLDLLPPRGPFRGLLNPASAAPLSTFAVGAPVVARRQVTAAPRAPAPSLRAPARAPLPDAVTRPPEGNVYPSQPPLVRRG